MRSGRGEAAAVLEEQSTQHRRGVYRLILLFGVTVCLNGGREMRRASKSKKIEISDPRTRRILVSYLCAYTRILCKHHRTTTNNSREKSSGSVLILYVLAYCDTRCSNFIWYTMVRSYR